MLSRLRSTTVFSALIAFVAMPGFPAVAAPAKNVVLVHGALADGSGCARVYEILTRDGFHVSVVQQPKDGILSTDLERFMAKRAGSTVTEIASSHVVFISHPEETAKVIEAAAKAGE